MEQINALDYSKGEKITNWCLWGNVFLTGIKIIAGIFGNSKAMLADGLHSASDVIATLVVLVGLKIAKKPADDSHPFGHGKIEPINATIVGLILFYMGGKIIYESSSAIFHGEYTTPTYFALAAALVSIAVKEYMYRITIKIGNELNSESIKANAWDHRSDAYSSIGVFVGITGSMIGAAFGMDYLKILDPIAGIAVAFFILRIAYVITRSAIDNLMDASPDDELCENISKVIADVYGVEAISRPIRARFVGPHLFVDAFIRVDKSITVWEGHEIANSVKRSIMARVENIGDVVVHVDPLEG